MASVESRDQFQDSCAKGERDGCVVDSEPLARVVTGFVSDWKRGRPSVGGQFGASQVRRVDVESTSALDWLSEATGIPRGTIENLTVRGRDGKLGRSRTTELRIADPIVAALGRPELFHDGTLEVKPNPHAKAKYRKACCGGSLTGTVEP